MTHEENLFCQHGGDGGVKLASVVGASIRNARNEGRQIDDDAVFAHKALNESYRFHYIVISLYGDRSVTRYSTFKHRGYALYATQHIPHLRESPPLHHRAVHPHLHQPDVQHPR
ncbi:hypothetical protein B0H17DRAFT_1052373 [Mycena rosella]|uniref:Uncharacterized protein n=1 Tax=Mycena rosella TaxID=1033263 RepID=A0AAD7GP81_MYCRO|nr:hypothetical protein B0H17DRAFT_1052373 [Mycena rosella]